MNKPYHTWD